MKRQVSGLLLLVGLAAAQPASDLLQSAIYSQDTLGDLNAAIRIYQRILNSGTSLRVYAAQAQYRLGVCLLRKGDKAGAVEAFQSVIRTYPEQAELVARARENLPAGNSLLKAPWSPTEVTEYRWTIPGVPEGWSICRIGNATGNAAPLRIQMSLYAPRLFSTQVDVDRDTMRPLLVSFRAPGEGIGRLQPVGSGDAGGTPYESAELLYLLRRMPLAPGWSSTLHLNHQGRTPFSLKATASAVEDVVVPAGNFKCLRVQLSSDAPHPSVTGADWPVPAAGETLWYSVTGARPLVKIESGQFKGELASLRTAEQIGTSSYRDPQVGYSFTVPAGWVFHPRGSFNPPGTSVDLLDPESQVWVVISGKSKSTNRGKIGAELKAGLLERLHDNQQRLKNYRARGAPVWGTLGGHTSFSFIADYTDGNRKAVHYITWVQSEATRASIAIQADAADFERSRERLQAALDSFRMP